MGIGDLREKGKSSMRSFAILMLLSIVACGDDSPTRPSVSPPAQTGPPPEARVTIERLDFDIGLASIIPPRLYVTFDLRIKETAGVGITLDNAQYEVFDPSGRRYVNSRVSVNENIAANGQERIEIRWVFSVNPKNEVGSVRTTYRFVDRNGYTKELQLTGGQTEVSGLRQAQSTLP